MGGGAVVPCALAAAAARAAANHLLVALHRGLTFPASCPVRSRSPSVQTLYWNDRLIVAGLFEEIAGVRACGIAAYNFTSASWARVGAHNAECDPNSGNTVWRMAIYNNQLVAVGNFAMLGGTAVRGIARLNSTGGWEPLPGGGVDAMVIGPGSYDEAVNYVYVDGADLYIGGK